MVAATGKFDDVASLIVEQLAITREEIAPEARIVEDLRCVGDDADWEADPIIWGFWFHLSCLVSRNVRENVARGEARIAPVRVRHLVHCAETKVWQHPDHFDPTPRKPVTTSVLGHLLAVAWRLPFVLVAFVSFMGALAAPTFPWGLLGLAIGLIALWALFSTVRAAVHYYADRKSAGALRAHGRAT